MIGQLMLAALLGGIIGIERELHHKPIGLRTHALVCMGSALFTIVSISFVGDNVDVSRVAAGVVVGIGFLGTGLIFKAEDKIRGMTTAAELWVLAAVGLAIGLGLYILAIASTVIILLILAPGKAIEKELDKSSKSRKKKPSNWF